MPKCFLVGYGSGVGHGAATAFRERGFELVLFGRNPQRFKDKSDKLEARVFQADAALPGDLSRVLQLALAEVGPPEVFLYNAVAFRQALPSQLKAEDVSSDLQTNLGGAVEAVQTLLPVMAEGSLLFTGGGWALYPNPTVASTAIGKAALRHYALMLSQELRGRAVKAATLTILGEVKPGGPFDPRALGEAFARMHLTPSEELNGELQFSGQGL